jgi:hypothetical protein
MFELQLLENGIIIQMLLDENIFSGEIIMEFLNEVQILIIVIAELMFEILNLVRIFDQLY